MGGVPFPFSVEALGLCPCLGPELPDERPLRSERGDLLGSRSNTSRPARFFFNSLYVPLALH
jgi:hypothetical protein